MTQTKKGERDALKKKFDETEREGGSKTVQGKKGAIPNRRLIRGLCNLGAILVCGKSVGLIAKTNVQYGIFGCLLQDHEIKKNRI